ncbi:Vacuolar membrane-associated protein iml1 [Dissostichus eleginoides]|uniref:Vacuolar membrane-associated protein iml1 n=1 Tax=Dissostichus eleginoides TaxID=100907 RepID=A0AAD9BUP7_DISEL|nr:Vacuolar membrane-associated protein iml1 [Dissostichus eleginoides]
MFCDSVWGRGKENKGWKDIWSLDPNVTPLGLCPGLGPAVCDGQASGACGGSLLRGFKLAQAELCMEHRVKSPAMVRCLSMDGVSQKTGHH